jgi:hypothetical protein
MLLTLGAGAVIVAQAHPGTMGTGDMPPATERSTAARLRNTRRAVVAAVGVVVGAGLVGSAWALTAGGGETPTATPTVTVTELATLAVPEATPEPDTFILLGTFELTDGVIGDGAGGCKGTDGYSDIFEGTSVTVYDAEGTVIATGYLGESTRNGSTCEFQVAVSDVPAGEGFYSLEISHRGQVQLSEEEARTGAFSATLG